MKKNMRNLAVLFAALTFGLTSCSKEDPGVDNPGSDGTSTVQLKVYTQANLSRAAGTDTQGTSGSEATLATKLFVVVYDDQEVLETYEYLNHTAGTTDPLYAGISTTDKFKVKTGGKYFFVISDPAGALSSNYVTFVPPSSMSVFQDLVASTNQAMINTSKVETANGTNFVNATLWPKLQTVETPIGNTPLTLINEIGRLVGKTTLVPFTDNNNLPTTMAGTFSAPRYRMGTVAVDNYWIGRYEGTTPPPSIGHGQVISASYTFGYKQSADYTSPEGAPKFYTQSTMQTPATAVFHYVNENTSKPDGTGKIYYGNTTHIQFQAKYKPDNSEVYDGTGTDKTNIGLGTLDASGSFWTGYVDGKLVIFDQDPRKGTPLDPTDDLVDDETDVRFYYQGYNQYRFPIRDRREATTSLQCRVIRNHYYEVKINSINHLGEPLSGPDDPTPPGPDPDPVDPTIPIEDEVELDLTIRVLQWAKISQGEDL